jgi:carbonic anhydrase
MKTKIALTLLMTAVASAIHAENLPITAEQQASLTPDEVIQDLMEGNKRFVNGKLSDPNVQARVKAAAKGQYPQAVILSCLDSRVPVEQVFDQGIGDIFVGRVAGNVENGDQLGSMEFATKVAGAKLIMVLGHEACGAVKGATDNVEMGNLTGLLDNIKPAVAEVQGFPEDQRNSKNAEFVAAVVKQNVKRTVADIRASSPVLADMEQSGEIKIVGAIYSLQDGSVTLLD